MKKNLLLSLVCGAMLVPATISAQLAPTTCGTSWGTAKSRALQSLTVRGGDNGDVQISGFGTTTSHDTYSDLTAQIVNATAGAILSVKVNSSETYQWMHGYIYIDYNNDGEFTVNLDTSTGLLNSGSELVSYSYYSEDYTSTNIGFDSDGNIYYGSGDTNRDGSLTAEGRIPAFTLPTDLAAGSYRMRFKADWSSIDACGNDNPNNLITANGGYIIDFTLQVAEVPEASYAVRFEEAENGIFEIQQDGVAISSGDQFDYGTVLTVVATPAENYVLDAITVNDVAITGTTFNVHEPTVVVVTFKEKDYVIPGGTYIEGRYLTSITSTGAKEGTEELNYTGSQLSSVYVLLDQTLTVVPGSTFTITFTGHDADDGDGLHYTHAQIFADWNCDKEFSGSAFGSDEWIAMIGEEETDNAAVVLNIAQEFTVPVDAVTGNTRIRISYTDGWHGRGNDHGDTFHGPNAAPAKGVVYDIPVRIESDLNGLAKVANDEVALYYQDGAIYTNAEGEVAIYNLTGKLVKSAFVAPVVVDDLAHGIYIAKAGGKAIKFVK